MSMLAGGLSFGASSFGTTPSRGSLGGRGSIGGIDVDSSQLSQGQRQRREGLDLPCVPATLSLLHSAKRAGGIEGGKIQILGKSCGLVSLVGYVISAEVKPGEAEVKFSDGTCSVDMLIEVRTEDETWMIPRLDSLVEGALLRVICLPYMDEGNLCVRGIHFEKCEAAEYSYFHDLEVAHFFVKNEAAVGVEHEMSELKIGNPVVKVQPHDVSLPEEFAEVVGVPERNACAVLRQCDEDQLGVNRDVYVAEMNRRGFSAEVASSALDSLKNANIVANINDVGGPEQLAVIV